VKSYRAHMTSGSGSSGTVDVDLEVVTPDRFHMKTGQLEMIIIGNTTYVKMGTTWQKMTLTQTIDLSLADAHKFEAQVGTSPDVKLLGPEVLDGTPTLVYQMGQTSGSSQTVKMWVGVADGLPRKVSTPGTIITFSDYNSNITINPPIP